MIVDIDFILIALFIGRRLMLPHVINGNMKMYLLRKI